MRMAEARRMAFFALSIRLGRSSLHFFLPLKNTASETRPLVRAPKWLRVRTANALLPSQKRQTPSFHQFLLFISKVKSKRKRLPELSILIFDEPTSGLDPRGMVEVTTSLRTSGEPTSRS